MATESALRIISFSSVEEGNLEKRLEIEAGLGEDPE